VVSKKIRKASRGQVMKGWEFGFYGHYTEKILRKKVILEVGIPQSSLQMRMQPWLIPDCSYEILSRESS
jgi:hypothetical protein